VLRRRRPSGSSATADSRLGLEADASLRAHPHWLTDARRLGALHARLSAALGESEAAAALLQAGCLHGLRDAAEALATGWSGGTGAASGRAPRLSLTFLPLAGGAESDLAGGWPERQEAEGRIAALGRSAAPCCFATAGYASGWLSGLLGEDILAVEVECAAAGATACRFVARRVGDWRASGDRRVAPLLARLDFAELRAGVAEDAPEPDPPEELAPALDGDLPVVQVWGPVMVLPFSGADDSIATLESVSRDAAARDVSVVVLDLGGALLERVGGAIALERVLDALACRGADTVVAGVSPRNAAVVEEVAARHMLVKAELPAAIAAAFQLADARRRPC
jgi:hypothetical protein